MNWKRKRAKEKARAEAEAEEMEEIERIEVEPLTETDVQRRIAELFKLTDLQEGYGYTETGMELIRAQLRLIDNYVAIARIKADVQEANVYYAIERLRSKN